MMPMISRGAQGFVRDVSGSFGHLVEGSLQVVDLLPFIPCLLQVESLPVVLVGRQGGNQLRIDAPGHVFR
jgi:hypothetical protein